MTEAKHIREPLRPRQSEWIKALNDKDPRLAHVLDQPQKFVIGTLLVYCVQQIAAISIRPYMDELFCSELFFIYPRPYMDDFYTAC